VTKLSAALLLIVGAAIGVGGARFFDSEGSTKQCENRTVRIAGRCASLRPGKPVDPLRKTRTVARQVIDADPGPGQFRDVNCTLEGVALDDYDVYRCRLEYWANGHATVALRLTHDRRISAYRFEILSSSNRDIVPRRQGLCDPSVARYC
jgi:hypothetical protein